MIPDADNLTVKAVGGLALLALMGSVLVCASSMRKPGAVKKCYLSFILFACGLLFLGAVAAFDKSGGRDFPSGRGGLFIFAALVIPGLVLAFLGLSDVRRAKPPAYGRVPALATLILAGCLTCALLAAIAIRLQGTFAGVVPAGSLS